MQDEENIGTEKVKSIFVNSVIAGSGFFLDQFTNPSKYLERFNGGSLLEWYPKLIYKLYDSIGATPIGDLIPEYSWYSTDVLRVGSWYSMTRLATLFVGSKDQERNRIFSLAASLVPAFLYEMSQAVQDPKDYLAYLAGGAAAYYIDKKTTKMIPLAVDEQLPQSVVTEA